MRKYRSVLHESTAGPEPRRRYDWLVGLVILLVASPLAWEGALVICAQWRSMAGDSWEPRTPVLDALGDWWRVIDMEFRLRVGRFLNSGPWSPSLAVPAAVAWACAMASLFLRRVR